MLKAGIVGLPNVGKSTLFNALVANAQAQAANFPFCTIEPNVGVVAVPDARLQKLSDLSRSKEIIPTRVEFVDIAGLVQGASQGEGLGNKFLANIREVDAIVHVVRCFEDDDVIHVSGERRSGAGRRSHQSGAGAGRPGPDREAPRAAARSRCARQTRRPRLEDGALAAAQAELEQGGAARRVD